MGDLNAVDVAQQVHLEILRDCQCMQPGECIQFRSPLPASHTLEGLYIDDRIITQVLPAKKPSQKRYRDEVLLEQSRAQYAHHGIPTSQGKAFEKADRFIAWGTELDNRTGRVGASAVKLKHLTHVLAAVCQLRSVTKKLLQGVTGLLVHPFMHRRSLMCQLQETFIWIERLGDKESKPLPVAVKEELIGCALTLPLCHSNFKWDVSCRIGASDASLNDGGRAATWVPQSIAHTLYRYAEHKGEHVRLDWASGALQPESSMQQAPKELEEILWDLPWNQTESCSFSHRQHINILEARMIQRELQDLVHSSDRPLRNVLKGRSSAKNLNRILKQSLGWSLAGRKTLHLVWVRSEANPSDYPSRKKRIPEPRREPCELTKEIFGSQLQEYRERKSNRDIWRSVSQTRTCAAATADLDARHGYEKRHAGGCASILECGLGTHPALSLWSFREIFARSGNLTKTIECRGRIAVQKPFETSRKRNSDHGQDILDDQVFGALCEEASRPKQLWHFGIPVGSFSIMQNMNQGTRNSAKPAGDGSSKRERIGNEILRRTTHLCLLLHAHGSFFTLENPVSSMIWKMPEIVALMSQCKCQLVELDQCQYGLRVPDIDGKLGPALKRTRFVGTIPRLGMLGRLCKTDHHHVAVLGDCRFLGKWRKRSQIAGPYPASLCKAYAKVFEQAFVS